MITYHGYSKAATTFQLIFYEQQSLKMQKSIWPTSIGTDVKCQRALRYAKNYEIQEITKHYKLYNIFKDIFFHVSKNLSP